CVYIYSLSSEIEVLQSIYVDELLVENREDGCELSLVLFPSTAEDSVSQFVCLTLTLTLDSQYPSSSPHVSIRNPRGLSDDKLHSVRSCLQSEAQSCLGSPVLYQLIEKAKEMLTESNIPHGSCAICLYGFKEEEAFTKTCCYHHFHSHCLGRYVRHSERELLLREQELKEDKTRDSPHPQELSVVCPVCREPLTYNVDQLLSCPAPKLPDVTTHLRWRELQKLLEKQRSKGGIIDPEEESNRFLIHINEPPTENGNQDSDLPLHPQTSSSSFHPSAELEVRPSPSAHDPTSTQGPAHRFLHRVRGPRRGRRPGQESVGSDANPLNPVSSEQHVPVPAEGRPMSQAGPEFHPLKEAVSSGRGHQEWRRRLRGSRPRQERSGFVTERLDKLSLGSDEAENCEGRPMSQAGPVHDSLTDAGHQDRRRRGGHQRRPGPPRYHWKSRAPRGPGRGVRPREEVL
uniref:E3 ubiquitin-protein ligase RNF25 n=1 Tax=Gouania willdenowi TaxID=441366 RepID=A0A8C5E5D8_GOUWI